MLVLLIRTLNDIRAELKGNPKNSLFSSAQHKLKTSNLRSYN